VTTARLYLSWSDFWGRPARHTIRVAAGLPPDSESLAAACDALQSLSYCSLDRADLAVPHSYVDTEEPFPGGGGALVYCVLMFYVTIGTARVVRPWSFPDPDPALFNARGFVDREFPGFDALVSAVQACCTDDDGHPYGAFAYGYRSETKDGL